MYSFPLSHAKRHHDQDVLSRPDVHGLIIILLPLLQLTIIHLLGIRHAWARHRLIPTTFCGILGLIHFHYAIFLSPTPYPYANYLTSIVESVLLLITSMTVMLNALTQIILEGAITRPLIGLGTMTDSNLFGIHPSSMPSLEDDFSIAMLRLGTASFEATGVAGLQNQVASIPRPTITLERGGIDSSQVVLKRVGFGNEIATVQAAASIEDNLLSTEHRWQARKQYLLSLWRIVRNLGPHMYKVTRRGYSNWRYGSKPRTTALVGESEVEPLDPYQVFLKGGNISDDEEDPFLPEDDQSSNPSSDEEDESEDKHDKPNVESLTLYTDLKDLVMAVEPTRPSTPVLVAHLMASGQTPLTRRRYHAMSRATSPPAETSSQDWMQFVLDRRHDALAKRSGPVPDIGYTCVICTVEPRDIICWPCR
jgi:hypothetical protein